MEIVFDIEATGLLDTGSIEYKKYPFKLKPTFQVHCIVAKDLSNKGMIYSFTPENLWDFPHFFKKATKVVGHNIIDYDLMVVELFFGLKFDVDPFTIDGKEVEVCDTLVLSKLLNPDRSGGHGLAAWGERLSFYKDDFGKHTDWSEYSERMRSYCVQDVHLNHKVYAHLMLQEWRNWNWKEAFWLEQTCRHYITVQSHFGFQFDSTLATWCVGDLTQKMGDIEKKIEPLLPSKKMTKGSAKEFTPPKIQVKKNGDLSAHMQNFVAKHSLECKQDEYGDWVLIGYGRRWTLPMGQEPIFDTEPMRLADQDAIKQYLMSQGWEPTAWKEKDLTINTKKQKLSDEKYQIAVDRYIDQTVNGEYFSARIDHLKINAGELRRKLTDHNRKRPLRVLSTPSFTSGQEKKICSNLVALGAKFDWIADLVLWLTYRHRKNSIQSDKGTGWLNEDRILDDGRISTPADTLGTNTFRYTHKSVANVPRATSTYGGYMRALFGVPEGQYQIGSDAAGLEARVEAHFTRQFEGGEDYAKSLISEKPNDIHCYSEDTEILTQRGWRTFGELGRQDQVAQWDSGVISMVEPREVVWQDYEGDMVRILGRDTDQLLTPNHRVLLVQDRSGVQRVVRAEDFKQNSSTRVPVAGDYTPTNSGFSCDMAKLLVAVQSDGSLSKDCAAIKFSFVKKRKRVQLLKLLDACNMSYTEATHNRGGRDELIVRIPARCGREIREHLKWGKEIQLETLLKLSGSELRQVFEEVFKWDGWVSANGNNALLDQTSESMRDLVVTIGSLLGYKVSSNTYKKESAFGSCTIFRACVSLKTKPWIGTYSLHKEVETYSGKIGCVSVPSGFVVVRRNGKVFISGNTVTAAKMGVDRDVAKKTKYGITYGAQVKKIAKMLGISLEEAEKIFKDFWAASLPLDILKEHVATYWKTKGHKVFIRGIDGRKLMTRSEHSLLNVLFQSTGAIVMKRQMVMYMRKLKDRNMYSNPFRESEILASQMMHYHDECQWQVSPKIIDMYTFDTKEEAESFEIEGKVLSNVKERGGVYTRGWSEVGQVFSETMAEAGQYYKFRVPLAADYDIGANWSETH